jgi:hypothetical protein
MAFPAQSKKATRYNAVSPATGYADCAPWKEGNNGQLLKASGESALQQQVM